MPPHQWAWQRRIHFPETSLAPLDFASELWQQDRAMFESAESLKHTYKRIGRDHDAFDICYQATRTLVGDVLDAVGGMEGALLRLDEAIVRARAFYKVGIETHGELMEGGGVSDVSTSDAWYALEEMLMWARALDERLQRDPKARGLPPQGLVPALAHGPRRSAIVTARSRLLAGPFAEARLLANLNLHVQSTQAGSKSALVRMGDLVLRFPDRIGRRIEHRWELTYNDDRDGVAFALDLWLAVKRFMDDMLRAFEAYVPERLQRPPPTKHTSDS
jgi:hypothetical protein